jgi:hypothetical protein
MKIKWKVAHLLILVLAAAIMLAIQRSLWGPTWRNAVIVFGAYLVSLVTASIAAYHSEPRYRRLWLGYAAFGWAWVALVLRDYLGKLPDLYAPNKMDFSILGMALGVLCALASQFLPGMKNE